MAPPRMEFDLLVMLAAAKVGSAIEDIEQAITAVPDHPDNPLWRDVKDCLHDAYHALKGTYK